jgi:uncharacterized short protein YbdD (DUF466 family)
MALVLKRVWALLREATGDDAYERYLAHWCTRHADDDEQPLERAEFYRQEQRRKWDGVRRCC